VPVCLADEVMEYNTLNALLTTFLVNKETRLINSMQLRKGQRMMAPLNGEQCQTKLTGDRLVFDQKTQLCSMHEPQNPLEDGQPVRFLKAK
jgi:hypothetical protein